MSIKASTKTHARIDSAQATPPPSECSTKTETRFGGKNNIILPRATLNPDDPQERAWRFLSNEARKMQDAVGDCKLSEHSSDGEMDIATLHATLKDSGAFKISEDDGKEKCEVRVDDTEALEKWTKLANSMKAKSSPVRATAAPFEPSLELRRRMVVQQGQQVRTWRLPVIRRERLPSPYEADLSQFVKVKKQKRKAQGVQEVQESEGEQVVSE